MSEQLSRRSNLLISQVSILFISLVSTFIPEYSMFIFLLYFIILMFITFKRTKVWVKPPPQRELGAPIFKETNVFKIAMFDRILIDELKKQARASLTLLMSTLLVIIIFPIYRALVLPLTIIFFSSIIENALIVTFLSFLVMYEVIFGLMSLIRSLTISRSTVFNLMLPQNYVLYRNGIVLNERFFVKLTPDHCYEYSAERRFVEIRTRSKQSTRLRLYTDAVSELRDKVREIGLKECTNT